VIFAILRTGIASLRRDRFALILSFALPVGFFAIFALITGGIRDTTPKVTLIVVDEDRSANSASLVQALQNETSLRVRLRPVSKETPPPPDYTAATAEAAVKAGDAPVALIIPRGFGANPIAFGPNSNSPHLRLLNDSSDIVAPQMVNGLLQRAAMTSMPDAMAEQGMKYTGQYIGGLTPEQNQRMQQNLDALRRVRDRAATGGSPTQNLTGSILAVDSRAVVGENKPNPLVSFYAAAFGVMFLLFTASGAAGVLLEEAESGTLDRVLSSRINMTTLLAGKLVYCVLLAFTQLVVMFVFGWLVFRVDLPHHIPGFVVMGLSTAFATSCFGLLLASICRTRAQLGSLSTLLIMTMSAIGGSMYPRYFMPEAMQKAGLFTINGWAIDGFTKVFWRDMPVTALGPQVGVLLGAGIVLFLAARRIARRWEAA
jgi:ABC-2 type transport system permease protein